MDKCRDEFEAYIVTRYPKRSKEVVTRKLEEIDGYQFYTFKEIEDAWVIWQHQQAKVEEAEAHTISVLETGEQLVQQVKELIRDKAELQKRVDAALAVLTEYYTGSYDESPDLVVDIEQALKGEGCQ